MAKVKISLMLEKGDTLGSLLGLPVIDAHIKQEELIVFLTSIIRNNNKISSSVREGIVSVTYHKV